MQPIGKILVVVGLLIVVAGIIVSLAGDKLNWIGKLPGDIRIEKENFHFYMPITTMILFSILISGIGWLVKRFF